MRGRPVLLIVEAELQVDDPWGRAWSIKVRDGRGSIDLPRAALGYTTLRSLPRSSQRERWAMQCQHALAAAGVTIDVLCAGRCVARLAPESRGNRLGRLLRLGPVEVSLGAVIAAIVFRRARHRGLPHGDG